MVTDVEAGVGDGKAVGQPGATGATRRYLCGDRDQLFLLPVCMRDWLEDGHLAWFVLDVVASMDTSALHDRPGGCEGRPPYEPEMMCALLLYGYCTGVRFSRRIEAACQTAVFLSPRQNGRIFQPHAGGCDGPGWWVFGASSEAASVPGCAGVRAGGPSHE